MKPPKNQSPQTKPIGDAEAVHVRSVRRRDKTADTNIQSQAGVNMHSSNNEQVEMVKHSPDTLRGDDEILKEVSKNMFWVLDGEVAGAIKKAIALTKQKCEDKLKNQYIKGWIKGNSLHPSHTTPNTRYKLGYEKGQKAERQRILEKEIVLLNDIIDWINTSNQQGKKKYFLRLINFIKDTIEELKREIIQNEP